VGLLTWLGASHTAHAVSVPDITQTPLTGQTLLQPNLLLILDDSGSMQWTVMPDDPAGSDRADLELITPSINGVYYDPAITYQPPYTEQARPDTCTSGENATCAPRFSAASYTAAWFDGFNTSAGSTHIGTYKAAIGFSDGPNAISNKVPAFSHTFKIVSGTTTKFRSLFVYAQKNSDGTFTRFYVGAASEDNSSNGSASDPDRKSVV
jgi:type IV pilus assembly protein PilY1